MKAGDIIHGSTTCGNVYLLVVIDHESHLVLGQCLEIETQMWVDMEIGAFVIRTDFAIDESHLASACPHGT